MSNNVAGNAGGNDRRRRSLGIAIAAVVAAVIVYLAWQNQSLTRFSLLMFAVLVPSVILHEVSHGAVALVFGDDTAKRAGRLTLNPIAHIDPFFTVILPGMLALLGAPVIGMAKPVPVNPRRMRRPKNQSMITALAGPATNVVLAVVAALVLRAVVPPNQVSFEALLAVGLVNTWLAVFNMIPLPPLDGSSVIERFLPDRWLTGYLRIRQYSVLVLFAVVFLADDLLARIVEPAFRVWESLAAL